MHSPDASYPQRRHRELSWLLYITEGYVANAAHALAVNCVTFDDRDKAVIERVMRDAEETSNKIRQRLSTIK